MADDAEPVTYTTIAPWAAPERQHELESKVKLVAFDGDSDYPLPMEIARGDDGGFVLVDYELDDDDEYLTGNCTTEPGPLDQLIVSPLTQDWRPVGSMQISGLTETEVLELIGGDSYRQALMQVVPRVDSPDWDGVLFSVNALYVGRTESDLVLISVVA